MKKKQFYETPETEQVEISAEAGILTVSQGNGEDGEWD